MLSLTRAVIAGDRVSLRYGQTSERGAVQIAVSRLPRTLTAGTAIEHDNPGPGGIYARLEDAGHILARFEERVCARLATTEEASTLRLSPGSPVLAITRTAYTADDTPIEINDMVLAADRYELVYNLPAD